VRFWRAATDESLVAVGPHPEAVQPALESRIEVVGDGASVAPGITALATPGHISLVVSSGTDRALIMGDAIHCPLQFDERDLGIIFDVDADLVKRTRERIAAELEQPQTIGVNGHFADSVFGWVLPGQGTTWHRIS
jgi:glyoxylase-like metal-dependent hydrolase (beta-lactamase superfamily II)